MRLCIDFKGYWKAPQKNEALRLSRPQIHFLKPACHHEVWWTRWPNEAPVQRHLVSRQILNRLEQRISAHVLYLLQQYRSLYQKCRGHPPSSNSAVTFITPFGAYLMLLDNRFRSIWFSWASSAVNFGIKGLTSVDMDEPPPLWPVLPPWGHKLGPYQQAETRLS